MRELLDFKLQDLESMAVERSLEHDRRHEGKRGCLFANAIFQPSLRLWRPASFLFRRPPWFALR